MKPPLRDPRGDQSGFTLVETLVAGTLLLVVLSLVTTTVVQFADTGRRVRADHNLNEEARNSLNRMARELRQATSLLFAANPDGTYDPTKVTALSIEADFNGDGCTGNGCASTDLTNNPETITYCFDPQATGANKDNLWLIPTELTTLPSSCQLPGALPILAGNVAGLKLSYRSSAYRFDVSPSDGVTTWQELDAAPPPTGDAGGSDGNINTAALAGVDSLTIELRMRTGTRTQTYQTQVELRNK